MTQLLQNAVYGTAMILTVAVLRRVLKDRLAPGARLALWAACLFRLLTPAAPESVLSLWGLGRWFARKTQDAPAPDPVVSVPNGPSAFVPAAPEMAPPAAPAVPAPQPAPEIPWETILLALWAAVGIALAVRYALSYARTRRAVECAIPIGRDDPRYAPLPRCARLREGVMEGAPLTFGVVTPTVVLLPGLAGEELACVLAHEGVHARRRDNLWHYVTALALVIHWWNPAVWLMARLLRRDVELSCDRAAVKKLGADRRAEYANALISMATQGKDPAFCQTFGRKAAEERVISIMKYKKMTAVGAALTLALVLAVTVGFACNPTEKNENDTVEYHGQTYNRADLSQETLDWLDWYLSLSEEGQLSVSMVPPELIGGLDVSAGDAEAGNTGEAAQYICTREDCGNTGVHTHDGVTYRGWTNKHAIPPFCTDEACTVSGPHWHEDSETTHHSQGEVPAGEQGFSHDPNGPEDSAGDGGEPVEPAADDEVVPDPVSQSPWPVNSKGQTYGIRIDGKYPDLEAIQGPQTGGQFGYLLHSESEFYGYPGTINSPEDAMDYMAWMAAQPDVIVLPLYDSEGNVIGEFRGENTIGQQSRREGTIGQTTQPDSESMSCPVCAVEGCAIEGRHEHNGVTYCGGAAHRAHGETTCDGSCLYCAQQAVSGGHHSESHSSGHHENGHH